MSTQAADAATTTCVENGVWTPVPVPPPDKGLTAFTLKLADVDGDEDKHVTETGVMTFHTVGCTGNFSKQAALTAVAQAMTAQSTAPGSNGLENGPAARASFLYHLGDIVYTDDNKKDPDGQDQITMYRQQFYEPYTKYGRSIFAIAGNHDGKPAKAPKPGKHHGSGDSSDETSAIAHFLLNFCAAKAQVSSDNNVDKRAAMTQPYVYWRLSTPVAYIIGLYSNISNGGILDNPFATDGTKNAQYQWLVHQLREVAAKNKARSSPKAVLVAVHYPPYSAATNFAERGDPRRGPTKALSAAPLASVLQNAFTDSGVRPDALISAHAHLYQRLTYQFKDGYQLPCLVVGCGGHSVENLWSPCDSSQKTVPGPKPPVNAVLPDGMTLPSGDSVQMVAYDDTSPGFARVTIGAGKLTSEYFAVEDTSVTLIDAFTLDMTTHAVTTLTV